MSAGVSHQSSPGPDAQASQHAIRLQALRVAAEEFLGDLQDSSVPLRPIASNGTFLESSQPETELKKQACEAETRLDNASVDWLASHIGTSIEEGVSLRDSYLGFKNWLSTLTIWQLTSVLGLRVDEAKTAATPGVKRILETIDDARFYEKSRPSPVLRRIYLEWTAAILGQLDSAEGHFSNIQTVHILMDSNVLLDLVTPARDDRQLAMATWKLLEGVRCQGHVEFHVSRCTIDEFLGVLNRAELGLTNLQLRALLGKRLELLDVHELDPFAKEFLDNRRFPSYASFANSKLAAVFGSVADKHCPDDLALTIVDESRYLKRNKVALKVDEIRKHRRGRNRSWDVDYHDVALPMLADALDSAEDDEAWLIWSHHREMPEFAAGLGLRSYLVNYGPALCLALRHLGKNLPEDQLREVYRSSMVQDKLEIFDTPRKAFDRLRQYLDAKLELPETDELTQGEFFHVHRSLLKRQNEEPQPLDELPVDPLTSNPPRCVSMPASLLLEETRREWHDFTLPFGEACGGHGAERIRVLRPQGFMPSWEVSVHSSTHVDLPWALDLTDPRLRAYGTSGVPAAIDCDRRALRMRRALLTPRPVEVVLLRLTYKREILKDFIVERGGAKVLNPSITANRLASLVKRLAIDHKELSRILESVKSLTGKVVVLHTGWTAAFMPRGADLASPHNEMSAAWLVHPWLTPRAARDLIHEHRPEAVGVDAPMLDCPCYVLSDISASQKVHEACKSVFSDRFDQQPGRLGELLCEQPVHSRALPNGVLLLENLDIPNCVEPSWTREHGDRSWYKKGWTYSNEGFVTFLRHPLLMDGALGKLLVRGPYASRQND